MNIDFSSFTESAVSNSANYLKPYEIYNVKLTKFERGSLTGSKDPSKSYDIIAYEFTSDNGVFSDNLFIPKDEDDFARKENTNSHKLQPSRWDRFNMTIRQMIEVLNPTAHATMVKLIQDKKIKDVNTFVEFAIKALNGKSLNSAYLKLVGRNANGHVYATLPSSCWFDAKDNKVKPLNFISTESAALTFSPYEVQQQKEYQNAAPTNMDSVSGATESKEEDINLDELEF